MAGIEHPLPARPQRPGIVFRAFRGMDDLAALAAVHAGRATRDQVDPCSEGTPTVDELAATFIDRPDFDPAFQLLLAEANGQIIGYVWIRSWAESDTRWALYHRVLLLPAWRGRGIGTALLGWAEAQLAWVAGHRPLGVEAVFRTTCTDAEQETAARLETAGYTIGSRTFEMALSDLDATHLPAPEWPEGVTVRAPRPDEYRPVYLANEAAFAEEFGHIDRTEDDFDLFMSQPNRDPSLWRVAWATNETGNQAEVAAVLMMERRPCGGFIDSLSVMPAFRRRGLGRALLLHGLRELAALHFDHVRLYVEADDPFNARALYERAGFHTIRTYLRFVRPLPAT